MINIVNNCCVRCEECNHKIFINLSDLNYDEMCEIRRMGEETEHKYYGEIYCNKCESPIAINISVFEYPMGAINYHESTCEGGCFIEKPIFKIKI